MTRTKPARQKKRPLNEIQAMLLEAGEQLALAPETVGLASSLTFKAAFQKVEENHGVRLTNASVIGRAFATLEDYRRAVLIKLASSESNDFAATGDLVFRKVLLKADISTPKLRWEAMQETCRVAGNAMVDTLQASKTWQVWLGIMAYATADPVANDDLIEALRESYLKLDEQSQAIYSAAIALLGFKVKPGFSLEHFGLWADMMAEGAGLRVLVDPGTLKGLMLPTGPGGKKQRWTPFALGFWALVQVSTEVDPKWKPSTS